MRIVARSLVEARVRTSVDGRLDGAVRPRVRRALRAACCGKRQAPVDGRLDCVAGIRVMRVSCARSLGRESGFGRWTPGYRRGVQYLGSGHMNERNPHGFAPHSLRAFRGVAWDRINGRSPGHQLRLADLWRRLVTPRHREWLSCRGRATSKSVCSAITFYPPCW